MGKFDEWGEMLARLTTMEGDSMSKEIIDWKNASEEQLQGALAELKRREPLQEFDNVRWESLSDTDFEVKGKELQKAIGQNERARKIRADAAELEAERQRREGDGD